MRSSHAQLLGAGAIAPGAADVVSQTLGLFNIFVGLMIVAAALCFFGGLITWAVLLGTVRRVMGIRIMEWGVAILFVLAILLAVVQFFQSNPAASTFVVSALVVCAVGWALFSATRTPAPAPEKK